MSSQLQAGDRAGASLLFPAGAGDDIRANANDLGNLTDDPDYDPLRLHNGGVE